MRSAAFDLAIFFAVLAIAIATYGMIDAHRRLESSGDAVVLLLPSEKTPERDEIVRGATRASRDLKIPFIIDETGGDVSFIGDSGAGLKHDVYASVNSNEPASAFAAGYVAVLASRTTVLAMRDPEVTKAAAVAADEEEVVKKNEASAYARINYSDRI
jgi:hypothetical protein